MVRKKSKPINRYVYIMRVRLPFWDLRWIDYRARGRALYKVGVATDAERRAKTVDKTTKAAVKLQDKYYCVAATQHERHLHQRFQPHKFYMVGMDGGTEVFRLGPGDLRYARRYLKREAARYHNQGRPIATTVFILALVVIYLLIKATR